MVGVWGSSQAAESASDPRRLWETFFEKGKIFFPIQNNFTYVFLCARRAIYKIFVKTKDVNRMHLSHLSWKHSTVPHMTSKCVKPDYILPQTCEKTSTDRLLGTLPVRVSSKSCTCTYQKFMLKLHLNRHTTSSQRASNLMVFYYGAECSCVLELRSQWSGCNWYRPKLDNRTEKREAVSKNSPYALPSHTRYSNRYYINVLW